MGEARPVNGAQAIISVADHPAWKPVACPLSTYQRTILQWVANGKRDGQIASIMGNTTEGAIQQHVTRILNVLGSNSRAGAAAMALRRGWIK